MGNKTICYFKEISKIPRESYNEKEIANYIVNFAKERNLDYIIDEHNNVIVKKYISGKEPVILQAHIDMVCEKEENKVFNFKTDSIEVIEKDTILLESASFTDIYIHMQLLLVGMKLIKV